MATLTTGLSSIEIVRRYLAFFRERGHQELAGSPLVLPGIGTNFVIAGMQPLMPYLRGHAPPPAPRLTALQRCLRGFDADAVGTNARKLTSFHMLGNWSIGEYGKREAIGYALELLDAFNLDRSRLWVTTFGGEPERGLAPDFESVEEWRRAGISDERIVPLGMDDNLWSTGEAGPCGPCTELYMDLGLERGCGRSVCRPGCECDRFLEFWNLVFIEFEETPDGRYVPLPFRSVDTGLGLERIALVLQGTETVFETDLFAPARQRLAELAPIPVSGESPVRVRARRRIVDHTRAALLAGLAGVEPERDGRGSVVRRLIRRAARQGRILGLDEPFLGNLVGPLAEAHGELLTPEERLRTQTIAGILDDEERRFQRVLSAGLRYLDQLEPAAEGGVVPGERIFMLHAERGFPADLAVEILAERGLRVEWSGYEREAELHRSNSRVSKERRFQRE